MDGDGAVVAAAVAGGGRSRVRSASTAAARGGGGGRPAPTTAAAADHRLELFSPVLRDGSDSADFSQLSRYHRLILRSLRLVHLPPPPPAAGPALSLSGGQGGGGGGWAVVSFHCQYCSRELPPPPIEGENDDDPPRSRRWTTDRIVEVLPSVVECHMANVCEALPAHESEMLPSAKSSGKMPFDRFVTAYFAENGIVDVPDGRPGGRTSTVMIPDKEFLGIPG
jgi:hypothetical protein